MEVGERVKGKGKRVRDKKPFPLIPFHFKIDTNRQQGSRGKELEIDYLYQTFREMVLASFPAWRLGMYSQRLCLWSRKRRRSLPEWIPSLESGNQLGQGLCLNLVPFVLNPLPFPLSPALTQLSLACQTTSSLRHDCLGCLEGAINVCFGMS